MCLFVLWITGFGFGYTVSVAYMTGVSYTFFMNLGVVRWILWISAPFLFTVITKMFMCEDDYFTQGFVYGVASGFATYLIFMIILFPQSYDPYFSAKLITTLAIGLAIYIIIMHKKMSW